VYFPEHPIQREWHCIVCLCWCAIKNLLTYLSLLHSVPTL